jgi:hypothetical protein
MAKLKFDLSDVEPGQDFDTPIPKGVYKMKINEIVDAPSKSDGGDMYTVELEVIGGDWKGRRVWDYIKYNDDTSQWKLGQLLEALEVVSADGKRKGVFDPEDHIGTIVVVRVKHETDEEYGTSAKVGSMQPLPEDEAEEAQEEADAPAESAAAAGGAEPEEVDAAGVRKMDLDELKEFAVEQELTDIKFTKRSKAEKKQDEIIEALELEEGEEIEDPEDWDALAALDREQLEAYNDQAELELDVTDYEEDDELRAAIAEELEIEVPLENAETTDFNAMSVKELKATCSEQGLETKGGKKALVKRLEDAASTSGGNPDDEPF